MHTHKSQKIWSNSNLHTNLNKRENRLRAAVLGANDGIVSIAGLVIGVAEVTQSKAAILTAGLAGIVAGALSMAVGEYISVSTQRDTEKALLAGERRDLKNHPQEELSGLETIFEDEGLSKKTATTVAKEFTEADAFTAHAEAELHINPKDLTNPWTSLLASAGSFILGSTIPLITIMLPIGAYSVPATFVSVIIALIIAGTISAKMSGASIFKSTLRVVIGGTIAMVVTYIIGNIFRITGA